jgi:hypothetical protein
MLFLVSFPKLIQMRGDTETGNLYRDGEVYGIVQNTTVRPVSKTEKSGYWLCLFVRLQQLGCH